MTQAEAFEILKTGASVFLTGNAGSGKTHLLNRYISWLKQTDVGFAVTASTGIAATHIGGTTIHSFSGIGIRRFLDERDLDELTHRKYLWDRFSKIKVLIIDEISMLHAGTLDVVDQVCKTFKQNELPFGGLQLVLTGDFFQLPPIDRERDSIDASQFAYNSQAWTALDPVVCYLTEQHRQNDPAFTEVLNAIRNKTVNEDTVKKLKERIGVKSEEGRIARLFAHNEDVDRLNLIELEKLESAPTEYKMETRGRGTLIESLKKSVLAPESLQLKEGALVMCVKNNYEKGYVNGTLGTVISCEKDVVVIRTHRGKVIRITPDSWAVEENGKIKAEVMQIPLRLAWAITIHKSQGMSMDAAVIDLSKSFTHGMGYVALSRVRSLDGLFIIGLNDMALSVHPAVSIVDEKFKTASLMASEAIERLGKEEVIKRQKQFVSRSGGIWLDPDKIRKNIPHKSKMEIKVPTETETLKIIESGKSIKETAKERGLTEGTIMAHLERLQEKGEKIKIGHLKPTPKVFSEIQAAFIQSEDSKLTPVKDILDKKGHKYSFEEIRLTRLFID